MWPVRQLAASPRAGLQPVTAPGLPVMQLAAGQAVTTPPAAVLWDPNALSRTGADVCSRVGRKKRKLKFEKA